MNPELTYQKLWIELKALIKANPDFLHRLDDDLDEEFE